MNRSYPRAAFAAAALCLALGVVGAGCSDDPEIDCPDGYRKEGNLCLQDERADSGEPVTAGERKDARAEDPQPSNDAGTKESEDSGSEDASSTSQSDSGADASTPMDGGADAADASDGSTKDSGSGNDSAAPGCDATHACPSSGYFCMANKCVSSCTQTQCTANSTCGLVRGAPVCTCNSGYLPVTSGGRLTSCTRDVACSELGCDENASCELGSNQVRHCVCKAEYVGDGRNCTRVTCPALNTLRIENGHVVASGGATTVGKVAVFECNEGYRETAGGPLVCDESGKWTGTPTVCSLITCGKPTATVEHAALTMPDQTSYRVNQTASYACAQGYKPRGATTIACKSDGTWTAPALACVLACGDGTLDNGAPYSEECDPSLNPLSAWTCSAECKLCTGGVCRKSCNGDGACPAAFGGFGHQCSNNLCVLSGCSAARSCPTGAMCMQRTCIPGTPASGS